MTIEMREVYFGTPVSKYKELPVGKELDASNRDCMRTVRAISSDFLFFSGTTRDRGSWVTDGALKGEINSLRLGTMTPGLKRQFRWREGK